MILERLIDQDGLSEAEKQISHFILDKDNDIDDITSTELGKRSYTSQSAVIRLYKKLGLKNYREFISKVIIERNEYFKSHNLFEEKYIEQISSYENIQKMISGLYAQTMINTNLVLDKNMIIRFCNRIISSKMIDIYAVGNSEIISKQMAEKLQTLGIYCSCHNALNKRYIQSITEHSNRIALIISIDESNELLIGMAKALKSKKIYTISLCDKKEKELIDICQDNLIFSINDYTNYENVCSYFAVEYILNIIYSILLSRITK